MTPLTLIAVICLIVLLVWIGLQLPTPWRWILLAVGAVVTLLILLSITGVLGSLGTVQQVH